MASVKKEGYRWVAGTLFRGKTNAAKVISNGSIFRRFEATKQQITMAKVNYDAVNQHLRSLALLEQLKREISGPFNFHKGTPVKPLKYKKDPYQPSFATPEEYFSKYAIKSENPDDCWGWSGRTSSKGYVFFQLKGKVCSGHRESYKLYKGEIPPGMFICHTCDNPTCTNPSHLYAGTAKDNVRDIFERGRRCIHVNNLFYQKKVSKYKRL